MDKLVFYQTDCESILSQIKHKEKQLKLKRRWLLGLPTSKSEHKQLRESQILSKRSLPESLLREDDIIYETIKSHVEKAFGVYDVEKGCQVVEDSELLFGTPNIMRVLDSCLDALTNKGLYLVATILIGGSFQFEKTRPKMKKVIRGSLSKGSGNKKQTFGQKEIVRQLYQVLNDPKNFQENCAMTPTVQCHRAAAAKVLDELEDLPSETLIAMQRKLRCVRGVPRLQPHKCSRARDHLLKKVRKISHKMLSELGEEDELQEQLAKAMAIADLSRKLSPGYQNRSTADIYQFSAEVKSLQNEIVKAIWLLKTKVRLPELKNLQLLLEPNTDVRNGCLRTAVKKMLTEYLFECSDMDTIPKSLLEALAVINRSSRSVSHIRFPKEEIEEEVEFILRVSAQTKQIVWDLLPDHEFDQDFTDAYMEELEESDDGDGYDDDDDDDGVGVGVDDNDGRQLEISNFQHSASHSFDSDYKVESTAEWLPVDSRPPTSASREKSWSSHLTPNGKLTRDCTEVVGVQHLTRVDSGAHGVTPSLFQESRDLGRANTDINQYQVKIERDEAGENTRLDPEEPLIFHSSNFSFGTARSNPIEQSSCRNQYLTIQDVCDETSMIAYNLIGRLLEKFAEDQGVDLDWNDSIYLGCNSFYEGDSPAEEKRTLSEEDLSRPVIVKVVEELMPSLPKSGIERLKELMGT